MHNIWKLILFNYGAFRRLSTLSSGNSWIFCSTSIWHKHLSSLRPRLVCRIHTVFYQLKFLHWCTNILMYTSVIVRNSKMHTFFFNYLTQLYGLRHVSNNQVFIFKKTCTFSFMVYFLAAWSMSECAWSSTSWHSFMKNVCILLVLTTYVYHNGRFKKRIMHQRVYLLV
jgi:hypothetical protein